MDHRDILGGIVSPEAFLADHEICLADHEICSTRRGVIVGNSIRLVSGVELGDALG